MRHPDLDLLHWVRYFMGGKRNSWSFCMYLFLSFEESNRFRSVDCFRTLPSTRGKFSVKPAPFCQWNRLEKYVIFMSIEEVFGQDLLCRIEKNLLFFLAKRQSGPFRHVNQAKRRISCLCQRTGFKWQMAHEREKMTLDLQMKLEAVSGRN